MTSQRWSSLAFEFGPLLIGGILAALLLLSFQMSTPFRAEEMALGTGTKSYYASKDGVRIHCGDLWPDPPGREADVCIDAAARRQAEAYALWLGNSQIHSINQIEEGDSTASQILFDTLSARGVDLITLSQPNANLQEHYLLFEYVQDKLSLQTLILPVVFDDTRESGVRNRLMAAFQRPGVREALQQTEIGASLIKRFGGNDTAAPGTPTRAIETDPDTDLAALEETVQEISETWLNDRLAEKSELWAARPDLRGKIFSLLYLSRNSALRIDPSTVRPLLPGPYAQNMEALEALLQRAGEEQVRVLVYIPPLRNDTSPPYVPEQYAEFKREVEAIARRFDADFADIENAVPGPLWGMKASTNLSGEPEYDFMHFQARGHALLAQTLLDALDVDSSKGWGS